MPTKKWSEEEEEFLKSSFMDLSNAELADKFEITKNAVQKKLDNECAHCPAKTNKPAKQSKVYETGWRRPDAYVEIRFSRHPNFVGPAQEIQRQSDDWDLQRNKQ